MSMVNINAKLMVESCPWMTFSGQAGTLEYAVNVYEWLEHEFGFGNHCIVCDEEWWFVEERAVTNRDKPLSVETNRSVSPEAGKPEVIGRAPGSPQRGPVNEGS